jgi:integration host factor subunit beta
MTKAQLIAILADRIRHLTLADVEEATRHLIGQLSESLAVGQRVEVRGFGSFVLHYRQPRAGHNPKTGAPIAVAAKHIPHFKPGRSLRERVNRDMADTGT